MTKADLHRMVDDLPDDAVEGASVLINTVITHRIDPNQAWVWTPEWLGRIGASIQALNKGQTVTLITTKISWRPSQTNYGDC